MIYEYLREHKQNILCWCAQKLNIRQINEYQKGRVGGKEREREQNKNIVSDFQMQKKYQNEYVIFCSHIHNMWREF